MNIEDIRAFDAPNVFSLRESVVKMKVKLGELAEIPTKDIPGLNDRILRFFPGVAEHKCATGYVGGFVDRLAEGTYLAHVTEHLCLELQRMLGYDMKFGKARQVEADIYNVIFACPNMQIGKTCGLFVFRMLNGFIAGEEPDFDKEVKALKELCSRYDIGPSTRAIVEEAVRRGIPVEEVGNGQIMRLGYGKYQKYISATLYEGTSGIAVDIACDKSLTKHILEQFNVPVPEGRVSLTAEEAIRHAEELGYPVVVKPKCGNKGKHVFLNISNREELVHAFTQAATFDKEIIVEKLITGKDYRLLVVNGKFVAASERIPAHVVGDGSHTVRELIEIVNRDERRGEDHEKPLTKIKADELTERVLSKQGIDLSHVPEKNQMIVLKETANLSTGGEACDCTGKVHPKNREAAELAARAIGLDIAGIDMVIPDIGKPIESGYGAIVEVNAAPGIRMHLFPTGGEKRDVAGPIVDMICPPGNSCSIPIISITGTNGKTTTTRMITRILMESGLTVGTTTTHGIFINGKCVQEGDTTGPNSARRILYDRTVEAAVLETARGGIVREGLAYKKADVAVFTNLTEDHLGIDDIHTMEELLKVKSLVVEAVKDTGASVLNADDEWVMKASEKAKGNIILYSMDRSNPHLQAHVRNGGTGVSVAGGEIIIYSGNEEKILMGVREIPATLNGALAHNIYNSLAAAGACYGAGIPLQTIRKALSGFKCDADTNPGRFNIYDLNTFKVVLDYGHNIDGYRVTIEGLKNLKPARLVGVIGVPGDRRDEDIRSVGELSGRSFNRIFIKEDQDLRGRKPLEVANVLLDGVIQGGFPVSKAVIVPQEAEALERAMKEAEEGDIIVAFFEKMEPLVQKIEQYRRNALHGKGSRASAELLSV